MTVKRVPLRRAKPSDSDDEDSQDHYSGNPSSLNPSKQPSRASSGSYKRARLSGTGGSPSAASNESLDSDEEIAHHRNISATPRANGRGNVVRSRKPQNDVSVKEEEEEEESDTGGKHGREENGDADEDEDDNESEEQERNHSQNAKILDPEQYDSESDDGAELGDSLHAPPEFAEIPHQPGAIVRVKLVNFVTYTNVTFEPGPSLNMIIGPNGTGKSTLVCAICLGLGYSPQHLGRAKDINEFVKNGSSEGTIEIELKGREEDETNPVIKRRIKIDGNSEYWINGKKCSLKTLQKLTSDLAIQIDNLCQFLPQDKVCEFAALTPVELLRETQRAAAPPIVLENHDKLKKTRAAHRELENVQAADQAKMTDLENRQRLLERDVSRLRQREVLQAKIKQLENCIPFQEYRVARQERDDAKALFKAASVTFKELETQVAPTLRLKQQAQERHDEIKSWAEDVQKRYAKCEDNLKIAKARRIDKLREEEEKISTEMKSSRNKETKRRKELEAARSAVQTITRQMQDKPEEIDIDEWNTKISDVSEDLSRVRAQADEKNSQLEIYVNEGRNIANEINATNKKIGNLENITAQKIELLKKASRDSHKVYEWLKENEGQFQGKVYGPPIVECSIKDQRYLDEVEQLFNQSDKLAFTCTNRNDYTKFAKIVYGDKKTGDQGLGVSDVTVKLAMQKLEDQQPACSIEEMRNLGFDGWALDFLDGPPEVLSMLCNEINALRSAVKLGPLSDQQRVSVQASRIQRWVEDKNLNWVVRRADYGSGAVVVNSRSIRPAELFKTPQVNPEQRRELEGQVSSLKEVLNAKTEQIKSTENEVAGFRHEMEQLIRQKREMQEEKIDKQKRLRDYNSLTHKLSDKQSTVEKLEEDGRSFKPNMSQLEKKLIQTVKKRVEAAIQYADYVQQLATFNEQVVHSQLRLMESNSHLQNITEKNMDIENQLQEKSRELNELRHREGELRNAAKASMERCRAMVSKLTEEDRAVLSEWESRSVEDLRRQIQTEKDSLEAIHEGNPNAIRQYEKREEEIRAHQEKMDKQKEFINKAQDEIAKIKAAWEPQIDLLISNISDAFSKSFEFINCAGQVRVHKEGNDFEKWAVEILVKFRESESMQVLTAQRQSGGERAVSTVFYLMALQSLARAPFRVVDEINQGMDPRNERLVHKRMVKIACRKHTSQYFLITPKLLVDLDYHERMKVLCINSGDWVQEEHVMDYGRYLEAGRKLAAQA